MPDELFAEARLAQMYDTVESDRRDLDAYVAMVDEFGARSVLDVGCGTGTLACLLVPRGVEVTGVDPAQASLDVARAKAGAERVHWIHGDATALPPMQVDLAVMTGNVAQEFRTDDDWSATLHGVHNALRSGGRLVFETRDPARQAWRQWTDEHTRTRVDVPGVGAVETWLDLVAVDLPLVTFTGTYVFESDGAELTSESTLRFWERDEVERSLTAAGFQVEDVRDAPDRPGREFVFVARSTA